MRGASSGRQKYSISICSNSRVRKIKFPGVTSLRKPCRFARCRTAVCGAKCQNIFEIDKNSLRRFRVEISERAFVFVAETAPTVVRNIKLNSRGSVKSHSSRFRANVSGFVSGIFTSCNLSWRNLPLQARQSTSGSLKKSFRDRNISRPDGFE
jgi:hypothetical protein